MLSKKNHFTVLLLSLLISFSVVAQTVPVGTPVIEDYYRLLQLNGELDSSISFSLRPLTASALSKMAGDNIFRPDTNRRDSSWLKWNGIETFQRGKGGLMLLPISWEQQVSSHHPYGWNDGSMIPARGYQTRFSGGFFAKYGPLSIQLRPEFIFARNRNFKGFNTEHASITWFYYYSTYLNLTDIPERFGEGSYTKANWGQSSVRLNFEPISLGISNENLWWGPGKRSSLIMSNNAPGFKYLTLNTTRPVSTPIGSFEGQMIAGRLENSGYLPQEVNRVYEGSFLYNPKRDDWRYLSGLTFIYQPKWVPGLFLGLNRVFQMYHNDMDGKLDDYIPFLQPFQKEKTQEGDKQRDQLASVFLRYLLREAKAEIYFEYGRNDHSENIRDFLMQPEHSRAYIAGFSKVFPIGRKKDEYIMANLEVTQLSQPSTSLMRDAGSWYVHGQIRQGYTNEGQVLGAGIGPGSNLQSFDVSWYGGLRRLGLRFERYIHNNDFYFASFEHTMDYRKRWVDLSVSALGSWNYKNLLFNADISFVRSLNYQYWFVDRAGLWWNPGRDLLNFQGKIGIMYRF